MVCGCAVGWERHARGKAEIGNERKRRGEHWGRRGRGTKAGGGDAAAAEGALLTRGGDRRQHGERAADEMVGTREQGRAGLGVRRGRGTAPEKGQVWGAGARREQQGGCTPGSACAALRSVACTPARPEPGG